MTPWKDFLRQTHLDDPFITFMWGLFLGGMAGMIFGLKMVLP